MAGKLEEARKIINEVDSKMAELFIERMRAAEMVFDCHFLHFGQISPKSPTLGLYL